jgi:stage V sporulation protein B
MRRLQEIGVSQFRANEIYGAYTTLALPVFSLIPSLITPISMALIPELTVFIKKNSFIGQTQAVEKSLRLTSLLSMPASLAVTVFSRQILSLLFSGQTEAVEIAAPLLSLLGGSVFFSCLITTTNAILQAYGCVKMPIFSMSAGVAVKAIVSYFLLGTRSVGVYGAPIGSLACNVTVVLLNFALMLRYTNGAEESLSLSRCFVKPFVSSVFSIGGAYALYQWLSTEFFSDAVAFSIAAAIAILVYFLLVILFGVLGKDDIRAIPIFKKLIKEK